MKALKTYLVTGGAGFLGCNLVRKLLEMGNKVIVYDNFSFGRRENVDIQNDNLAVTEGDIQDTNLLQNVMRNHNPEIVIHLAALHFIPYCNAHPCETLRVNVEGTQSLLEVIRNSKVSKIIAASTAAVYPNNGNAYSETDQLAPFDIYGLSKLFMEHLINSFHRETDKVCINARLFNIYGPYETNPHLIPRVMEQLSQNGDTIELGNLTPKRDYIYVDDVADAIIALSSDNVRKSDTFNIGTGYEYSVTDIVTILNKITRRNVKIESVVKYRRDVDREHLLSDISKIEKHTGWKPKYSIEYGLKKTAAFYQLV